MSLLGRLEPTLGRFAIPNITMLIIAGQVLAYVADMAPPEPGRAPLWQNLQLVPGAVVEGQWWRVITFLFDPPKTNIVFAAIGWYLFYLMGSSLETIWGVFRYNVFLGIGYVAAIGAAFLAWSVDAGAAVPASNLFLYGTVFLAFARFYPDFVLQLMFLLPVKIKWLAWLVWAGYAWMFAASPSWLDRAMVLAAVLNYLLFFGRDILSDVKHRHRRMRFRARSLPIGTPGQRRLMVHVCSVCGRSSKDEPRTPFRYCSQCDSDRCYCPDHLQSHEHVAERGQRSEVGGQEV